MNCENCLMIGMKCEILAWEWNEWTENRKIDTMLGFAVDC